MFEVGKKYSIKMIAPATGQWTSETGVYEVVAVEGALIKVKDGLGREVVINTCSWAFVAAEEPRSSGTSFWEAVG